MNIPGTTQVPDFPETVDKAKATLALLKYAEDKIKADGYFKTDVKEAAALVLCVGAQRVILQKYPDLFI